MGSGLAVHDPAGDSGVQQDDSAALGYRNTTHINPGSIFKLNILTFFSLS